MTQFNLRKNNKLLFCLLALLLFPLPFVAYKKTSIDQSTPKLLARKHSIIYNKPAPNFFEGALLGNGGMGVVVCTRPDAVVLYFGHNDVWDIRIKEARPEEVKDFNYVFNRVKNIPDTIAKLTQNKWYNEYHKTTSDNYNQPYPRPFPCGSIVLGFDRKQVELTGHELDISNGVCTVQFLNTKKKKIFLRLVMDRKADHLLMQLVDAKGKPEATIFNRLKVIPDPTTPKVFPKYSALDSLHIGTLGFRQKLPFNSQGTDIRPDKDKAFSLVLKVNEQLKKAKSLNVNGGEVKMNELEGAISSNSTFSAIVSLQHGFDRELDQGLPKLPRPSFDFFAAVMDRNEMEWERYWDKSHVELGDNFLEEIWYRNLYFFNCAVKEGGTCPGLFANWSYKNIGSEWHGDYHFNYNLQQPFWLTFSSNHLEKNLPYVDLIEFLMPLSRKWAKEYFGLQGAAIPHAAYPLEMTTSPYPAPDWGWEIAETPWAMQGLWWHYIYSADTAFLRSRVYEPIKAAVEFLTAYMKRPEARGGERWSDDKYHIFPTVPPEVHGLVPGFKYNYDCSLDLALTKFIFKAFQKATVVLGTARQETQLLAVVEDILQNYPDYPKAESDNYGKVFVSVPEEHGEVVYNIPLSLAPVFPGEDLELMSNKNNRQTLINTYKNHRNEGGNDLVFLNLQAARLKVLDLDQFKRQVRYCLLPNGTATNLVSETKGRYNDQSDFKFMADAGVWFENFSLPAVINECLMQGYEGSIKLFPNWPKNIDARFDKLRAAGAFLVSAIQKDGKVTEVKIISEKGGDLRLSVPWGASGVVITASGKTPIEEDELILQTHPGEVIIFRP